MATKTKSNKLFLLALFALSLVVRVFFFANYLVDEQRYNHDDSPEYAMMASQLAAGQGYVDTDGNPYVYRLPGYPFFLSIAGPDPLRALWVQVVLASFIPILIFFLALVLFKNLLLAQAASLWSALGIGFVLYAGSLLTESLFLIFFLLFLILFFARLYTRLSKYDATPMLNYCPEPACEGPSYVELFYDTQLHSAPAPAPMLSPALFSAGLLLGIASLIRPVGHYVIVLSLLWIIVTRVSVVRKSLSLALGWALVVLPWLLRNYVVFGVVAFHSLPGPHFLNLSASRVVMQVQDIGFEKAKKLVNKEADAAIAARGEALGRDLNELERSREQVRIAVGYFWQYPLQAMKNWATDIMRTGLSLHSSFFMHHEQEGKPVRYFSRSRTIVKLFMRHLLPSGVPWWVVVLIWLEMLMYGVLLLGIAEGVLSSIRTGRNLYQFLLAGSYILLFVGIGLAGGYARMRLPVEPLIIILGLFIFANSYTRK